jgi:hypothetical protein
VNYCDKRGRTPLMYACRRKHDGPFWAVSERPVPAADGPKEGVAATIAGQEHKSVVVSAIGPVREWITAVRERAALAGEPPTAHGAAHVRLSVVPDPLHGRPSSDVVADPLHGRPSSDVVADPLHGRPSSDVVADPLHAWPLKSA